MEARPLYIPSAELSVLQNSFPYHWCSSSLKYQGMQITPTYASLYQANYVSLFKEVSDMLKHWDPLPISWIGRINVLKISGVFFEILPIPIPMSQLKLVKC